MKKLKKVPRNVFWFLPMISIDFKLKYFYIGIFKWAYAFYYGPKVNIRLILKNKV